MGGNGTGRLTGRVAACLLPLVYFLAARLSLAVRVPGHEIAAIWLPDGFLLAALIRAEVRRWPWLFLAILPANLAANWLGGKDLVQSALNFPADCVAPLVAAWLIQRFAGRGVTLSTLRECLVFICATVACLTVSATAGSALYATAWPAYWSTWFVWWFSGELGILLAAPLLLAFLSHETFDPKVRLIEGFAIIALTAAVSSFLFRGAPDSKGALLTFPYWIFPCLVWSAVRLGPLGASAASALVSGIALWNTVASRGPFAASLDSMANRMVALESFLTVAILSTMLLAAVIADRQSAQRRLRDSETRLRVMVEHLPAGALYRDGDAVFLNKAVEEMTGYSRGEIRTIDQWFERVHGDRCSLARPAYEADRAAGFPAVRTFPVIRKDGSKRMIEFAAYLHEHGDVWLLHDVTERLKAEQDLREAESRYRSIFENAVMGIYQATPEGIILRANLTAARILGYESPAELMSTVTNTEAVWVEPADRLRMRQLIADRGAAQGFEAQVWRKDGQKVWISINARVEKDEAGNVLFYEGMFKDVSERKALEEELLQAHRMEAVGQLAGGIAHDFNNLLTVVSGYTRMILGDAMESGRTHARALEILSAADRAAALTHQLLAYSRRQAIQPRVLSLNAVVVEAQHLIRRLLGDRIELRLELMDGVGMVKADSGQIEYAIIQMAMNARDAMPEGGELSIETRNVCLDAAAARTYRDCEPGQYVMLAVGDTGHGMDAGTRSRVFEPFFTTKEVGKGTGLGMASVYGIVRQSGGHIGVTSAPGAGAEFRLLLPRVDPRAAAPEAKRAGTRAAETVLVLEDETALRAMVRRTLAGMGYRVLEADVSTVREVCANHGSPVDLLLTDVVMPGASGPAIARQLQALYPAMRVLFMSGYTGDAVLRAGIAEGEANFLRKPFAPDALAEKIRQVLA